MVLKGCKVYAVGDPERIGIILRDGVEVSEVKWENGKTQYINNDYLVVVHEKKHT